MMTDRPATNHIDFSQEEIKVLETAIDDMNPQMHPYLMEKLLTAGALDVYLKPVIMKKGRPGVILTVLIDNDDHNLARMLEIILTETTSLGVRMRTEQRFCLRRELCTAPTAYGPVRVKAAFTTDQATPARYMPEFEDCKILARAKNVPLRQIYNAALLAAEQIQPSQSNIRPGQSPLADVNNAGRCIDLSHTISPGMPVYPGDEPPRISRPYTIEQNGFDQCQLTLFSHTGTHLDSPAHMLKEGPTVDRLPAEHFYGPAAVIDATGSPGQEIPVAILDRLEGKKVDFVIFYTGWEQKWGEPGYFENYPVLAPATAQRLAERGIKGVGVDAVSVDPAHGTGFNIHKILLGAGLVIIENLTNLKHLVGQDFTFYCFPLKIAMADGSPVRATAVLK